MTLKLRLVGLSASYAVTALLPSLAQAQVLDEEIVVTAQRREENLQKVGISVSALSSQALEGLGISTTQEIAQQIPGLKLQTFSPGFTTFNLRGISQNNFSDNLEAPVAVYIDDIYIGSMNAINQQLFDTERVEVLRGPQGTLFGRNATGGLIHYRTKKATEDRFNGYVEGSYGEFNDYTLEGAVGGGLAPNLRARIAARYEKADGYLKAGEFPAGVQHTGRSAFGADGYVVRGDLQVGSSDPVLLDFSATYSKDSNVPTGQYVVRFAEADPTTGLGINPGPPITGSVFRHASDSRNTGLDRETLIASAKILVKLSDDIDLNLITGFVDMTKNNREDAGGGLVFFDYAAAADYTQWSQEVRLSGKLDRFRWQFGAYYLDIDFFGTTSNAGPVVTGEDDGIIVGETGLRSKNWSVFGQAEYDLTDKLTLIGGLRWSQDDKRIKFRNLGYNLTGLPNGAVIFDIQDAIAANPQFTGIDRIDYGDWAGRIQLNYEPNSDLLFYASINRGIKGGNWSPNAAVSLDVFRHRAETLVSYELGAKARILDGKGRLNASIYRYVYDDYQAFSLTGLVPQVYNSDAKSYGGEIELALFPTDHLDVNLGLAYISSNVDFVPAVNPGTGVSSADFPQAPKLNVNGLIRYNHDIGAGNASIQFDGAYSTRQYLEGTNSQVSVQKAYFVGNARIAYAAKAGWTASAWVKNVFNQAYLLYNLDLGAAGFVEQVYGRPRQFGGTLSFKF